MVDLVVCFSGRIGSGKTSVSRRIAEMRAAPRASFGQFVREHTLRLGLDADSREILQDVGEKIIEERGFAWFCNEVIGRSSWTGHGSLVVDGIRHVSAFEEVQRIVAPKTAVLIHLALPDSIKRGVVLDDETQRRVEHHSTEQESAAALPGRADLVVSADQPLENVILEVSAFLQRLEK